jgi:hypothetical protein
MITSPRRSILTLPVTRHFEFTRLQDQLIALAYQSLIPVVTRYPGRPRSRRSDNEPATTMFLGLRSKAGELDQP